MKNAVTLASGFHMLAALLKNNNREMIIAAWAVVLRLTPFRFDPALLFQPVKCRIKRPLRDLEHLLAGLLNVGRDRPPMHRPQGKRAQNEEIHRALKDVGWLAHT